MKKHLNYLFSLLLVGSFCIPANIAHSAPIVIPMPSTWTTEITLDVQNNMSSKPLLIGDVTSTFSPSNRGLSTKVISSTCRTQYTSPGATCVQVVSISTNNTPPGRYTMALTACALGLPDVCSQNRQAAIINVGPMLTTLISATPTTLDFNPNGPSQTITITNTGAQVAQGLTFTSPIPNIGLQVINTTCNAPLQPAASCQFTVTPGGAVGTATFNILGTNTNTILETVNVTSPLITTVISATPPTLNFNTSGANQTITITNTGTQVAQGLTSTSPIPNIGLQVINTTCNAPLQPAATCQFTVTPGATVGTATFNILGTNTNTILETVNVTSPSSPNITAGASELALSGESSSTQRKIIFTNNGPGTATNLNITPASNSFVPSGTTYTAKKQSDNSDCQGASLAQGDSCIVTFTPGTIASSNASNISCDTPPGTAPVGTTLSVSADNTSIPADATIYVIKYGCLYKGGFVFSINDAITPDTNSIGGYVVQTMDERISTDWNNPNSFPFSTPNADIPGIYETDTSSCDAKVNGQCNSDFISNYYNLNYFGATDYAANYCFVSTQNGFSGWYLPAICELGYGNVNSDNCGSQASPLISNIQTNLVTPGIGGFDTSGGTYWSSTEDSTDPTNNAWAYAFDTHVPTSLGKSTASPKPHLRCIRTF